MHQHLATEMTEGAAIMSADGKKLGRVRMIEGAHFKVDAALRRDYWLSMAYVRSVKPDEVVMSFDSADVGAYRLTGPVPDDDATAPPAKGEVIFSEEEQRETREHMARELAEQRQKLSGTSGSGSSSLGEPVESELARMEDPGGDVQPLADEDVPDPGAQLAEHKLPMEPFPKAQADGDARGERR
jgi:hypothetical protein